MMNPFKALGDLNAMRKQAATIQAALEQEEFEINEGNVRILISGNQNVKVVEVDGVANETIKRAINDAIKKSQQAAAMKLTQLSKEMEQ
jgi:DNA-binding protein YbaB